MWVPSRSLLLQMKTYFPWDIIHGNMNIVTFHTDNTQVMLVKYKDLVVIYVLVKLKPG